MIHPLLSDHESSFALRPLGELACLPAAEIPASRLSVGMECLDRRMYLPEKVDAQLRALGAKWARLQTGWARCETVKGVYDFAWLDAVVDQVIAAGVRPWFNVGYGNRLYSPDAPHASAVGQVPIYDGEEGVAAWTAFVRALTRHFRGRVSHFEIWNEPNIPEFWHPKHKSSGVEYTRLVAMTSQVIRAEAGAGAQIAACCAGASADFVKACFEAGIGPHIDLFSFHPYRSEQLPEMEYGWNVMEMRRAIAKHAPHVRLWQGECGAPAQTTGHHDNWMRLWDADERTQAKWLVRRLLLDHYHDLELSSYFHLCDLMETPYIQASGAVRPPVMLGLLNGKTYTPKLAYQAMQGLCTLLAGEVQGDPHHRCDFAVADGSALVEPFSMAFRRAGVPMLAWHQARDPQDGTAPVRADVTFAFESRGYGAADGLTKPVLIDPVTRRVYALTAWERHACRDQVRARITLRNVPVMDYPLLVTDAAAVGFGTGFHWL